jgi:putative FmdB family regulatory protein
MSAMPIYEFSCAKCGERFEVMGSYAEREKQHACTKCGSTDVKQAISQFSSAPPSSSF